MKFALCSLAAAVAILLSACAEAPTRPPLPQSSPTGAAPYAQIAPAGVPAALDALAQRFRHELAAELSAGTVQLLQEPSSLNLRCAHGLLFENDNAQLRADALALLSRIATVVDEQGGFVTQVVVMNADAPEDGEFGLSRRRAAAVAAELQQDGVPAARLRAQGRRLLDASGHAAVEWLFKPVVEEREAEAWTPPA